jgi:hypothetical protein
MSSEFKIQGPIEIEIKIYIADGTHSGVATISMDKGIYPTEQELRDRVARFARDEMPDGFHLLDKREFFNFLVPPQRVFDEDTGDYETVQYSMPGGKDYDA